MAPLLSQPGVLCLCHRFAVTAPGLCLSSLPACALVAVGSHCFCPSLMTRPQQFWVQSERTVTPSTFPSAVMG